jgi:uncharacterized protein YceH (UPF0502 family)
LDEVQELLNKLSESEPAYVKLLPRKPGQKESRYIHLFAAFDEEAYESAIGETVSNPNQVQVLEQRVDVLEEQLAALRAEFDKLLAELT